jgi:hypothetical protein
VIKANQSDTLDAAPSSHGGDRPDEGMSTVIEIAPAY